MSLSFPGGCSVGGERSEQYVITDLHRQTNQPLEKDTKRQLQDEDKKIARQKKAWADREELGSRILHTSSSRPCLLYSLFEICLRLVPLRLALMFCGFMMVCGVDVQQFLWDQAKRRSTSVNLVTKGTSLRHQQTIATKHCQTSSNKNP